jgi:hypothetical protein
MKLIMTIALLAIIQALLGCASLEPDGLQEAVPPIDAPIKPYRTYGGVI